MDDWGGDVFFIEGVVVFVFWEIVILFIMSWDEDDELWFFV